MSGYLDIHLPLHDALPLQRGAARLAPDVRGGGADLGDGDLLLALDHALQPRVLTHVRKRHPGQRRAQLAVENNSLKIKILDNSPVSPVCEDVHVVHLHADLLAAALVAQQLRHGADVVVLLAVAL